MVAAITRPAKLANIMPDEGASMTPPLVGGNVASGLNMVGEEVGEDVGMAVGRPRSIMVGEEVGADVGVAV